MLALGRFSSFAGRIKDGGGDTVGFLGKGKPGGIPIRSGDVLPRSLICFGGSVPGPIPLPLQVLAVSPVPPVPLPFQGFS